MYALCDNRGVIHTIKPLPEKSTPKDAIMAILALIVPRAGNMAIKSVDEELHLRF